MRLYAPSSGTNKYQVFFRAPADADVRASRTIRMLGDNAWPKTIVYRNPRHHAATKGFHEELGEPREVVAQYLGDKLTTLLNHYVRAGSPA